MLRPWSSEIELLLACARRDMHPAGVARARRAIAAGIDWDLFHDAAGAHGLTPLVSRHIAAGHIDVPPAAREALASRAKAIAKRSFRLTGLLASTVEGFSAAGLRAVPIKGPLLAERLYGSVAMRRMIDLDLLVPSAEFAAAAALLESRGFRCAPVLPAGFEALAARLSHHVPFVHDGTGDRIELHRYLVPPKAGRPVSLESFAFDLRQSIFMGRQVLQLAPEEELVYLCEHGAGHAWYRLEWLASVAELQRSCTLDESRIQDVARALRAQRRVEAARALCSRLIDGAAARPDGPGWRSRSEAIVIRQLSRAPSAADASWRDATLYAWLTDDGGAARARRTLIALCRPSEEDIALVPLPRRLWRLYGLVRPLRLAVRVLFRRHLRSVDP